MLVASAKRPNSNAAGGNSLYKVTAKLVAVVIVSLLGQGTSHGWVEDSASPPKLRLPADVAALRYRAELTVVPDHETFDGTVEIDLRFAKSAPRLWLNGERLTLKDAALTVGSEKIAAKIEAQPKNYVVCVCTSDWAR